MCPYFIETRMFKGVHTRFPLLLPILREDRVAEWIIRAIERRRPRLVMPALVRLVPALRLLPVGVFDALASFLGLNKSMDHFRGRAK